MFKEIYKTLVEFLGESKQGGYDKDIVQYQFSCPRCVDEHGYGEQEKYNLEVNLALGVFKCWKCASIHDEMSGKIGKLVKQYGTPDLYKKYKEEISYLKEVKMYELGDMSGITISIESNYVRLPKTFRKINIEKCKEKRLLAFLEKRCITQDIIDKYNIGYTTWDEEDYSMRNRIIIPSYDEYGDLNYYVARDFTAGNKIKYKNCNADKKQIIFQESLIDWDSTIYLCEGAFDAMRFPSNGVSMLGKSLSKDMYLFKQICKKANADVVIVLDGDTNEIETKRIYSMLNFGRLYGKVKYIDLWNGISKYKDMSEIYEHEGKRGVIDVLRETKQYEDIDLLF